MNMKKELPFKVDRALPKSLTQQVVDGFVRAIEFGVYKPGGLLPPFREVAERAGVSEIVARAAFRKLGQLGYVNPRLGIGTIVLGRMGYGEKRFEKIDKILGEVCDEYSSDIVAGTKDPGRADADFKDFAGMRSDFHIIADIKHAFHND